MEANQLSAKDLMCENILLLDDEKIVRVIWFRLENACIMEVGVDYPSAIVGLDRLKPIPLSEDILVKLGFEKIENFSNLLLTKNGYQFDFAGGRVFYLNGKELKHIKFLHQLQNLFFSLCGEELTFKN